MIALWALEERIRRGTARARAVAPARRMETEGYEITLQVSCEIGKPTAAKFKAAVEDRRVLPSQDLSQGAPITEASAYLGHANPQITLSIYSHWLPRTRTDSVDKLAAAIFNDGRVVHVKTASKQGEDEVIDAST